MSRLDPQPGETFFHPSFGHGCEVHIIKRGTRKGWGEAVWIELRPLTYAAVNRPHRIYRMSCWPEFAAGFADDPTQPTQPAEGE